MAGTVGTAQISQMGRHGAGYSFGTFGELVQGALPEEGAEFLVTLPVELYSRAYFTVSGDDTILTVEPATKRKALALATLMLRSLNLPERGRLRIDSSIPEGKGLASSSADLVASARAIAAAYHRSLSGCDLTDFLRGVEPTDGVMYEGAVAFLHRRVSLHRFLGQLPPMEILAVDEGGILDTIAYNQRGKLFSSALREQYVELLDWVTTGVEHGDLGLIGAAATRSAELNQRFNYKTTLSDLKAIATSCGAVGVAVAHSGTLCGVLLDRADPDLRSKRNDVWAALGTLGLDLHRFSSWSACADTCAFQRRHTPPSDGRFSWRIRRAA
ncbi:kinase [Caulobacter sp. S45]|uniref:GHMP family kinase ATP-binding protein n=1 Tax=Caulobacter sp. S45 TaxID=1641861 RepID=UPI00131A6843|nr:kinase [Caulobacter sp. S45]